MAFVALTDSAAMCLWNVSFESKVTPSHLIVGLGMISVLSVVSVPGMSTGVSIGVRGGGKGLGPVVTGARMRSFLRHEWWISSRLSGSIFIPRSDIHFSTIWYARDRNLTLVFILDDAIVILPSSTYMMSVVLLAWCCLASSAKSLPRFPGASPWLSAAVSDAVRIAVTTHETPDPWGVPVSVGSSVSRVPSKHIAVCRSLRKDATQRTVGK